MNLTSIKDAEEGCVLYLVKRVKPVTESQLKNAKDEVISMTKLKTLEYRFFRKIREKLRNFYGSTYNMGDDFTYKVT